MHNAGPYPGRDGGSGASPEPGGCLSPIRLRRPCPCRGTRGLCCPASPPAAPQSCREGAGSCSGKVSGQGGCRRGGCAGAACPRHHLPLRCHVTGWLWGLGTSCPSGLTRFGSGSCVTPPAHRGDAPMESCPGSQPPVPPRVPGRGSSSLGSSPAMAKEDRTGDGCCPHLSRWPQDSSAWGGGALQATHMVLWVPGWGASAEGSLGGCAGDPQPCTRGLPFTPGAERCPEGHVCSWGRG